ncbi:hypothetical protein GCM10025734_54190 [Kitasatospora paranensis]
MQIVWLALLQERLGIKRSDEEWEEILKQSLWLPSPVQATCIDAIATIKSGSAEMGAIKSAVDNATSKIVDYVRNNLEVV